MNPLIKQQLAKLASLSAKERADLQSKVFEEFDRVNAEDATAENVAVMGALANAAEKIAAFGAMGAVRTVTASGNAAPPTVAAVASRQGKPAGSPEAAAQTHGALLATAGLRPLSPGSAITDRDALGEEMARQLSHMDRRGPGRGPLVLARQEFAFPEQRRLGDDENVNGKRMEDLTGPRALAASGGICAPGNVDYEVPTWASAERPLRDGLPAFEATRGSVRFVQPPDISSLASATGIWTAATDANPAGATKPLLQVACGAVEEAIVAAVSTRIGFGNMQGRFSPEQVAANTDLAIAAAARIAENNLLKLISEKCVVDITAGSTLGATRDLLTTIDQAVANFRYSHRLPENAVMTVVFPLWARDLLRADLARELAHDNAGAFNVLAVTNEQIEDILKVHNVKPIWHADGQPAKGAEYPLQGFIAQTGTEAIKTFPAKLVWYMFPEGTMQFLDGGRLDLGFLRDSTLDATNDYETFVETFEGIANRGFAKAAQQFVSTLCANGASAATISTVGACA